MALHRGRRELFVIDHRSPWRSIARTLYFEGLMRRFATDGPRHLVFTPPSTRGSLVTNAEAWALNVQKQFVPTLDGMGRWPLVATFDAPELLSREQADWLSKRWGECASLWAAKGCPLVSPRDARLVA
jgi:hypothetical protein